MSASGQQGRNETCIRLLHLLESTHTHIHTQAYTMQSHSSGQVVTVWGEHLANHSGRTRCESGVRTRATHTSRFSFSFTYLPPHWLEENLSPTAQQNKKQREHVLCAYYLLPAWHKQRNLVVNTSRGVLLMKNMTEDISRLLWDICIYITWGFSIVLTIIVSGF